MESQRKSRACKCYYFLRINQLAIGRKCKKNGEAISQYYWTTPDLLETEIAVGELIDTIEYDYPVEWCIPEPSFGNIKTDC